MWETEEKDNLFQQPLAITKECTSQNEGDDLLSTVSVFGLRDGFRVQARLEKSYMYRVLRNAPIWSPGYCSAADRPGADVSVANKEGTTPLHLASSGGREATAWLLIDRGAGVSAVGNEGTAPLHFASSGGHEATARLLIGRRGAESQPPTNGGGRRCSTP